VVMIDLAERAEVVSEIRKLFGAESVTSIVGDVRHIDTGASSAHRCRLLAENHPLPAVR
jgi:hypothetical protein